MFSALIMTGRDAFSAEGVSASPSRCMRVASTSLPLSTFANRFAWIGLALCFSVPASVFEPMCFHGGRQRSEMAAGGHHVGEGQVIALPASCAGDREGRRAGQPSVMPVPSSPSPTAPSAPPC